MLVCMRIYIYIYGVLHLIMLNIFLLIVVLLSALGALLCRQTIYALLFLMNTFVMSAAFFLRA
jgi:hypothetical protein